MSFATTAAVIGATTAVAGLGMSAYQMASQPQEPDLASSSRQLSDVNAAILPIQRGLTAAAQSGGNYTFSLPAGVDPSSLGIATTGAGWYDNNGNLVSTDQNYTAEALQALENPSAGTGFAAMGNRLQVTPQTQSAFNQWKNQNQSASGPFGRRGQEQIGAFNPTAGLTWRSGATTLNGVPVTINRDGTYTVSFKGYGQSDVEARAAKENAANQLVLAQKYDPQFIAQALAREQEADPESVAARQAMSSLIQQQINRPLNDPVSELLNAQVQDTLNAASHNALTDPETTLLNAAVADAQSARGGPSGRADFAAPLTTGFAGEQRQANAAQAAMGFLSNGSSPEDIAYRREQQNLANLSAEVNGKTPQSQFASLSGAQSGPTPMVATSPLPTMPNNELQAMGPAMQTWESQMANANNQVNPWMQGLSSLIDVGSIAGNLGWKPFGQPANPAS